MKFKKISHNLACIDIPYPLFHYCWFYYSDSKHDDISPHFPDVLTLITANTIIDAAA